jgi:2-C-methyl-D-erythritol 4-phosphate cytidylyltransferase
MRQHVTPYPRKSALIPAAGLGSRLGLSPKCLLRIGQQSLLEILLTTIQPLVDEILVAVPSDYECEIAANLLDRAVIVPGGESRQDSIEHLIDASSGEILLIQDVARPFASRSLCSMVLEAAIEHGAAGAFLDPTVPVGRLKNGAVASYQSRFEVGIFQAPQAFRRDVLMTARQRTAGQQFQSTAQLVIDAGYALQAIPGEAENIKITTFLDWLIGQNVIAPTLGLEK